MEGMRRISKNYYVRQIVACFLVGCLLFNSVPVAFAGPGGANVVAGSAAVGQGGNTTTVTMGSAQAVINWDSLNTNSNEVLQFLKASGGFAVLNRVVQGGATQFDGSLFGNQGHILIVNPHGIVFGPTALVQAYKFTAAGLDISNEDFMNGHYQFVGGDGIGAVSNYGSISAEQVALIGKQVLNAGVISSPGGYVVMAAGDKVFLGQEGSNILVEVEGVTVPAATDAAAGSMGDVINEGTVEAAGGKIVLAAGDTFSRAVEGLDSLSLAVESGTGRVGQFGTLNADSVEGDGGSITMTAGDVVALSSDSVTTANAGTNGDGGEVIAYSPETALFHEGAQIQAKGGSESGDGGFVEVTGKEYLEVFGEVDAGAANGEPGLFYIDPYNVFIVDAPAGTEPMDPLGPPPYGPWFTPSSVGGSSTVSDAAINFALFNDNNVKIDTYSDGGPNPEPGDIHMQSGASIFNLSGGTLTLTLDAANDIIINGTIVPGTAPLNVYLNANSLAMQGLDDDLDTDAGDVWINNVINTAGGDFTSTGVNFTNNATVLTSFADIDIQNTGVINNLGLLDAGAGDITINGGGAGATSINDQLGFGLISSSGTTTLLATGDIGQDGSPINAQSTGTINASSTVAGDIYINNTGAVTLGNVSTTAGDIVIAEDDSITLDDVDTVDGAITITAGKQIIANDVAAGGGGDEDDVTLIAVTENIEVGNVSAAVLGDVILAALNGAITDDGNQDTYLSADEAVLTAINGDIGMVGPGDLDTKVNNLTATATGSMCVFDKDGDLILDAVSAGGDIDIHSNGDILQPTAQISKAAGANATVTLGAENIDLDGGIVSTLNKLSVNLNALDVSVNAGITTNGGSFTSSGATFDNTGGIINTAGTPDGSIQINVTDKVSLGADLNAGTGGAISGNAALIDVLSNDAQIQDGIDVAHPTDGATITVLGPVGKDTYAENLSVVKPNITLQSKDTDIVTLKPTSGDVLSVTTGADNFTLGGAADQGFTVDTTGTASRGVLALDTTGLTISHNEFKADDTPTPDTSIDAHNVDDLLVSNNKFTGSSAVGLNLSSVSGSSAVQSNVIDNYVSGIIVSPGATGTDGLSISGNDILNNYYGISFSNIGLGNTENVSVEYNMLNNEFADLWVANGANVKANTFTIQYNGFEGGTVGLMNTNSFYEVTAEKNWWGAADGPGGIGSGSGVLVFGDVDYSPWLGLGDDDLDAIGFQVASPMIWWTDDILQDAIDAASTSGDDVIVAKAGLYASEPANTVNVDKQLAGIHFIGAAPSAVYADVKLTNDDADWNWDGAGKGVLLMDTIAKIESDFTTTPSNQDLYLLRTVTDEGYHSLTLDTGTGTTHLEGPVTVGKDLTLMSNAASEGDMILTAGDSIYAYGTLTTDPSGTLGGAGDIHLYSSDKPTIHLFGDVTADVTDGGSIFLHNDTEVAGGKTLKAGLDVKLDDGKTMEGLGALTVEGDRNIVLGGAVTADGTMTLRADADKGELDYVPGGTMWAKSTLETTAGDIDIYAFDSSKIDLDGNVTAAQDLILNNDTTVAADKTLKAGNNVQSPAHLTAEGNLTIEATGGAILAHEITMPATPAPETTLTLTQNNKLDMEQNVKVENRDNTHLVATSTAYSVTSEAAAKWLDITATAYENITLSDEGGEIRTKALTAQTKDIVVNSDLGKVIAEEDIIATLGSVSLTADEGIEVTKNITAGGGGVIAGVVLDGTVTAVGTTDQTFDAGTGTLLAKDTPGREATITKTGNGKLTLAADTLVDLDGVDGTTGDSVHVENGPLTIDGPVDGEGNLRAKGVIHLTGPADLAGDVISTGSGITFDDDVFADGVGSQIFDAGTGQLIAEDGADIDKSTEGSLTLAGDAGIELGGNVTGTGMESGDSLIFENNVTADGTGSQRFDADAGKLVTIDGVNIDKSSNTSLTLGGDEGIELGGNVTGTGMADTDTLTFENNVTANGSAAQEIDADAGKLVTIDGVNINKSTNTTLTLGGGAGIELGGNVTGSGLTAASSIIIEDHVTANGSAAQEIDADDGKLESLDGVDITKVTAGNLYLGGDAGIELGGDVKGSDGINGIGSGDKIVFENHVTADGTGSQMFDADAGKLESLDGVDITKVTAGNLYLGGGAGIELGGDVRGSDGITGIGSGDKIVFENHVTADGTGSQRFDADAGKLATLNNVDIIKSTEGDLNLGGDDGIELGGDVLGNGLVSGDTITFENNVDADGTGAAADQRFDAIAGTLRADDTVTKTTEGDLYIGGDEGVDLDGTVWVQKGSLTIEDDFSAEADLLASENVIFEGSIVNGTLDGGTAITPVNQYITATNGKVYASGSIHKTGDGNLEISGGHDGPINSDLADYYGRSVWTKAVTVDDGELTIKGNAAVVLQGSIHSSGNMWLSANDNTTDYSGYLYHTSGTIQSSNGDVDLSAYGDAIYLNGGPAMPATYVSAGGDILIRDYTWVQNSRKLDAGDDVILASGKRLQGNQYLTVEAGDDIVLGANDPDNPLAGGSPATPGTVVVKNDLILRADDDIYAYGNIISNEGNIEIYSSDNTTYLIGDKVEAFGNILLNNNTIFDSGVDQLVDAQTGKITANGSLQKPNESLYLEAAGNVSLNGPVTANSGGVSIVSETGTIFTPGAGGGNDTLNVPISGYSDDAAVDGVVLPYGPGRAAIVVKSADTLNLGPDAELMASGSYDNGAVDDRAGVGFLDAPDTYIPLPGGPLRDEGDPFDAAIYLASTTGDVDVSSPVSIMSGKVPQGTMVIDAVDTVTFDGGLLFDATNPGATLFQQSVADGDVGDRLEVCSRITEWLWQASFYGTLPFAGSPADIAAFEAFIGGDYILRGAGLSNPDITDGRAWVLEVDTPPAPFGEALIPGTEEVAFAEGGCPALMAWLAGELGMPEETIRVYLADAFLYSTAIQPCEACARLLEAATILDDPEGTRIAALAQVVNEFVAPDAPIAPEQMASIASAMVSPEAGTVYAAAGEWLDALAGYVGILNTEMGFSVPESVAFVNKYLTPVAELDNASVAAYVEARVAALGG